MTFLRVAEKVPQYPKILTVQVVWDTLAPLSEAFSAFSFSSPIYLYNSGANMTHSLYDRTPTTYSAELLILDWLNAAIMRGIPFIYIWWK